MSSPRYELKFVLSTASLDRARAWVSRTVGGTPKYPPRVVNSLYYDYPDFHAAKENLSGVSDRRKFRLRWYDHGDRATVLEPVFEFKERSGRLNAKKRFGVSDACVNALRQRGTHRQVWKALLESGAEAGDRLQLGAVMPALQVRYNREYFQSAEGVRVTLDQDIRFHLAPMYGRIFWGQGMRHRFAVMEIKFDPGQHDHVAAQMRALNLVPKRHSKYVAGLAAFHQLNYL